MSGFKMNTQGQYVPEDQGPGIEIRSRVHMTTIVDVMMFVMQR